MATTTITPLFVLPLTLSMLSYDFAAALQNGLALTPPRGFSTWDQWPDEGQGASGHSVTEAQSMHYLQGMLSAGLNKAPFNYTYFIVDEPCFVGRDHSGRLLENKTTWPNGLQAFGNELRKHNMKLGIYTCVGPKTCGGCVASEGHEELDIQTFADWGAEYVKVDSCSRNCTVAAGVTNVTECGRQLWSRFTSAIKKTGKDIVYSIVCNCDPARGDQPWKWAREYANSWRTNIDFQVGWQAIPYLVDCQRRMPGNGSWCSAAGQHWVDDKAFQGFPGDGGQPCPCSDGHAPGACLVPALDDGGPQQFSGNDHGRGGHWNDMDMLAIGARSYLFGYRKNATTGKVISTGAGPGGSALTVSQSRAQLTMWSILKSPLLLSADFLEVVKWQTDPSAPQKGSGRDLLDIVRNAEVLAVSSDPLGAEGVRLEDAVTNHKSSPDVYVSQMRDGVYAVAMFNRNSSAGSLTFDIADLASLYAGSDKGLADAYHVRDLWKHTENGTLMTTSASTAFVAPVGGQDAVMMTLTPTSGRTSRLN